MRLIRKAVRLETPSHAVIDETYQRVRAIHSSAYNWDPPHVDTIERLRSTRMREYVRRWINAWDLTRLDPSYEPSTEVTPFTFDLSEDEALFGPMEDDSPATAEDE
jgi:hypothetical protein